jgi:hypothetical protein
MQSDLEVLGTILNTTFGKSSSNSGTRSITASFRGGEDGSPELSLRFQTIFHFAAADKYRQQHTLREQTNRAIDEAAQLVNERVKTLKSLFKEITGKNLKIKEIDYSDNVEFLPSTMQAQRKTAYYRRTYRFSILS